MNKIDAYYYIKVIEPFSVGGYFLTFDMNTGAGLGGPAADNKKKFYSYEAAKNGVKIAERLFPTKKFTVWPAVGVRQP